MEPRKVGRCKICAHPKARQLNKLALAGGWNAAQALEWASERELTFDRKTWYEHREHMKHPADALVTYAERAAAQTVPTVSNSQFLEAVRDLGMANALANPDSVTLAHSLKAVDLLERNRDRGTDLLAALAKLMLGARIEHVVTIEGTAQEVSA